MERYIHKEIEQKWQKRWEKEKIYQVDLDKAKKPFYNLMMFPYPSAEGLHVGNMYAFVHSDTYGRFMRLKGFDVFEPIGLDGFGIHSENYAIKIKEHIKDVSERTEKHFYKQLHQIGNAYDWSRTVETYKPNYYKWTQWLFLKMHEKGLAYRKKSSVNWCPSCKTVLSDEQVIAGKCERCSTETEKKQMEQWFWRITDYAERLLKNLDVIDWSEEVKTIQKNWIGKSEGAIVKFRVIASKAEQSRDGSKNVEIASPTVRNDSVVEVFTTRPDTLFGATYFVLSPEHSLVKTITTPEQKKEVEKYIANAKNKSEIERTDLAKDKTGVFTGAYAINPVNKEKIPVWIADYVLMSYGTGAIMAVPAHDERDWEFAKKYGLPVVNVIKPKSVIVTAIGGSLKDFNTTEEIAKKESRILEGLEVFIGDGILRNSDFLNSLDVEMAIKKMNKWLEDKELGKAAVNYKLRDWCISRQRYWGPPIPMIYCEKCAQEKAENVLILHGWEDSSREGFIPSFRENLNSKGYNTFAFDAPNTGAPVFEEWYKFAESKIKENKLEDLSLVGHSMGGLLALKLAEKYKLKKLILVAPVGSRPSGQYFNQYIKELTKDEMEIYKKYQNRGIDINKIQENVQEIIFIFGKKDIWITDEIRNFYKKTFKDRAMFYILDSEGHMSPDSGCKRLKFLEDLFKEVDKSEAGWVPVPEKDLPVLLPEMDDFLPDGSGKGPLNKIKEFVNTTCPNCKGPAKRETDVSDPFVDSSWYFMRYPCTEFSDIALDKKRLKKWMPVDMYIGGKEHSVLHLLYSRFVTMVMHELSYVPKEEPYKQFRVHGLLIAEGAKISKSKGNIVNPDEYIEKFGADAVRMYLMFLGDMRQGGDWQDTGIAGMYRFINKVWNFVNEIIEKDNTKKPECMRMTHKTIKKVTNDLENLKYNTAIAAIMEYINYLQDARKEKNTVNKEVIEVLIILLAPFAPHLSEELWQKLGNKKSVFKQKWPKYDPKLIKDETINLVVQINGKLRDTIEVDADISEGEAKKVAQESEKIKKWTEGKEIIKIIFVKGKLVNIVI